MAYSFGDSFDLYTVFADMAPSYWDVVSNGSAATFPAGRFTGSRATQFSGTTSLDKSSGSNDTVHHIVLAFQQTGTITGTSLGTYLTLFDGTTAQCSIVFRSDGAILLTSGGPTGTALATYTGAFPVQSVWYAFEFEVVINNTTGSFTVRKNGNTVSDFSATSLNTRASANNYANKIRFGMNISVAQNTDDLFWRSDASAVAWMGDLRCYTRMPASDAAVQFSRVPTSILGQVGPSGSVGGVLSANNLRGVPFLGPMTGTITSLVCNLSAGVTGHIKMALYDSTGASGNAGALLATSAELTNPGAGLNTFTITAGPTIMRGVTYWVVLWADVATTLVGNATGAVGIAVNGGNLAPLTYTTTFPSSFPTPTGTAGISGGGCFGMNVTSINAGCVNEAQQDATTSYVYDSTPGHADLYGIASIGSTPSQVLAVTTRALMIKSDAGTRTAAVQLKIGATIVASPTLTLTTSGWQWAWRTDIVDPNTSSAWNAAAVDSAQIGPKTVA